LSGFTIALDAGFVLHPVIFRTDLQQTAAAQAVFVTTGNVLQLPGIQYHCLALA